MDRYLFFWPRGEGFNPNNAKQTHLILQSFKKKYLFWHTKDKSMAHFYIVNALGQNLANSESCSTYSEIIITDLSIINYLYISSIFCRLEEESGKMVTTWHSVTPPTVHRISELWTKFGRTITKTQELTIKLRKEKIIYSHWCLNMI